MMGGVCCAASPTIWDVVHVSLVVVVCFPFPVLLSFFVSPSMIAVMWIPYSWAWDTKYETCLSYFFKKASIRDSLLLAKFKLGYGSPGTESKERSLPQRLADGQAGIRKDPKTKWDIWWQVWETEADRTGVVVEDWNSWGEGEEEPEVGIVEEQSLGGKASTRSY